MAQLTGDPSNTEAEIRIERDGPYLLTKVEHLTNWLGEEIPLQEQTALCRCGQSRNKPFCDGSHTAANFSGEKDPNRIPDKRDVFEGSSSRSLIIAASVRIQASAPTVWLPSSMWGKSRSLPRAAEEWMRLLQAVRACPREHSATASIMSKPATRSIGIGRRRIEVSKDGPYRITGGIRLVDEQGNDLPRAEGASREHFSLCRCGHSQNKPFCSGMHWYVKFTDPIAAPEHEPTLFEWAGGFPALLRMTRIFYTKYVPQDPLVGPLFANMSPDHPERVAAWLSEVFGGPKFYSEQYGGYSRMISQHVGKNISEEQRARWVQMLCQSADDAKLPHDAEFRAAFVAYLEWGSRIGKENSQQNALPPPNMPVPRWWWVCNAKPGSRVSAVAPPEESRRTHEHPRPGGTCRFFPARQTAVQENGSASR